MLNARARKNKYFENERTDNNGKHSIDRSVRCFIAVRGSDVFAKTPKNDYTYPLHSLFVVLGKQDCKDFAIVRHSPLGNY